jgi:hypothetical protein
VRLSLAPLFFLELLQLALRRPEGLAQGGKDIRPGEFLIGMMRFLRDDDVRAVDRHKNMDFNDIARLVLLVECFNGYPTSDQYTKTVQLFHVTSDLGFDRLGRGKIVKADLEGTVHRLLLTYGINQ